jgi:hypothetical protein
MKLPFVSRSIRRSVAIALGVLTLGASFVIEERSLSQAVRKSEGTAAAVHDRAIAPAIVQ